MPGVEKLLKLLSGRNDLLLGIVTGNFEESAWLKLAKAGLKDYFKFGGFACDSHDRVLIVEAALGRSKPYLNGQHAADAMFMVGDTDRDIRCAHEHGITSIAVATGSYGPDELKRHGARHVLRDLSDHNAFLKIIEAPRSKAL